MRVGGGDWRAEGGEEGGGKGGGKRGGDLAGGDEFLMNFHSPPLPLPFSPECPEDPV